MRIIWDRVRLDWQGEIQSAAMPQCQIVNLPNGTNTEYGIRNTEVRMSGNPMTSAFSILYSVFTIPYSLALKTLLVVQTWPQRCKNQPCMAR